MKSSLKQLISFLFPSRVDFRNQWANFKKIEGDFKGIIESNSRFEANGEIFIIVRPNVKIWILGKYHGIIIGQEKNTVKVSGEFDGIISSNSIFLQMKSHTKGRLFAKKLAIEEGSRISLTQTPEIIQNLMAAEDFDSIEIFRNEKLTSLYRLVSNA